MPHRSTWLPDFRTRADEPEWMDDLDLGGEIMRQTLDQLAVVNRFLGGGQAWRGVQTLLVDLPRPQVPFVLADLGCGGGESLRQIARWARSAEVPMQLIGFDANPHVLAYAREKACDYPEITFEQADICSPDFLARRFDVVTCSLVLHHFSQKQLQELLPAYLRMCRQGLVISDLQRHWLPWCLFGLVTKLLGASPMIRHDGMLSIRRGFTRAELRALLLPTQQWFQLRWCWAFRYLAVLSPRRAAFKPSLADFR